MKFIKENKKFVIIGLIILALVGVSIYSKPKNNNKDKISTKNGEVKIVKNDVSKISLEDYSNDLFKMKIPTGWKVDVLGDYIHYTIRAYNPENPTYQFFINLKSLESHLVKQVLLNWFVYIIKLLDSKQKTESHNFFYL